MAVLKWHRCGKMVSVMTSRFRNNIVLLVYWSRTASTTKRKISRLYSVSLKGHLQHLQLLGFVLQGSLVNLTRCGPSKSGAGLED